MSSTASKLQKSTVNEPNRTNKLETALKSIVTKRWWFFDVQQNNEFGRFDKNRRNLLESCSIKIVFLSNDREEFKLCMMQKLLIYNLPEVWKIFSNSRKRKNDTPLTQIIGRTGQIVAVGS